MDKFSNNQNTANNGNMLLSAVPFPNLIGEMEWYTKKKHAEIVYRKCIQAKRYKWAMKIAYNYGLQDETKNDGGIGALQPPKEGLNVPQMPKLSQLPPMGQGMSGN